MNYRSSYVELIGKIRKKERRLWEEVADLLKLIEEVRGIEQYTLTGSTSRPASIRFSTSGE